MRNLLVLLLLLAAGSAFAEDEAPVCRMATIVELDFNRNYQHLQPTAPNSPRELYILADRFSMRDEVGEWALGDKVAICDGLTGMAMLKNVRRNVEVQFLRIN
jgi:hypothetical protein